MGFGFWNWKAGEARSVRHASVGGERMRKIATVVLCVLGAVALVTGNRLPAADEADEKVDALVQGELARQRIPGVELGVYRDGKLTRAQGYGLANVEWDRTVTPDTIFQSGSVGKQFTATAVMMLVEEGKVGLDDPIKKYFPDAPETWNDIKVHNLLSHTSGLSAYERRRTVLHAAGFHGRRALQAKHRDADGFQNRRGLGLPEHQLRAAGDFDSQGDGKILWRLPAGEDLQAAGDEPDTHYQRRGHYSEARGRLPAGKRRIEKPGMGIAVAEFDGGLCAVFHGGGFTEVGRGAVHGETAEEGEPGADVDSGEAQQRQAEQSELWVRVGNQQRKRTSRDRAWWGVAGIYDLYCALRGRPIDRRGVDKSGFGACESEEDHLGGGGDLQSGSEARGTE